MDNTGADDIVLQQFLRRQLADASPDVLRSLLSAYIDAPMGSDANTLCGAGYGEYSGGRHQPSERLRPPGLRHPCRHSRHRVPGVPFCTNCLGIPARRFAPTVGGTRRFSLAHKPVESYLFVMARGPDADAATTPPLQKLSGGDTCKHGPRN